MSLPILSNPEFCSVQKPAQYLGGEVGSVVKDPETVDLRICLAFPDTYEVGMAHVGYQILYDLINRQERMWAERVYVPLSDMERLIRSNGAELCSLESKTPLSDFDVIGFSLQYELCMSGILGILDLGGLPLLQRERDESCPLIIGGGPVCYHPEPFAEFFDAFLIGDGEELLLEFLKKLSSSELKSETRGEALSQLSGVPGVYVPSLYQTAEQAYGVHTVSTTSDSEPKVQRRILASLENAPFPRTPIVPNIQAVHDRLSVEVMRGCVRGCRFCQAGYLYRPQRERSPEEIKSIIDDSLSNTGYEEVSLLSLSTADYCSILPLLKTLKDDLATDDQLAISFPSTRVDALKPELLREVQPIRRTGFTMAPEGGTQRIRDVINKGVSDEQIEETITNVFKLGWSTVKLYFMIGLPTETDEDVAGIIDIARRAKRIAGSGKRITISVSTHVPKPHTPFQWAEQISIEETKRKQRYLAGALRALKVNFRYHDAESSFLEGVFARGGRELTPVILQAYRNGTRLDGWVEKLNFDRWLEAFEECGIDPHPYLRERDVEEPLPWDHISCDIPKRYFAKEWERARAVRTTPNCLTETCSSCGACNYDDTRNVLFSRKGSQGRLGIINPPWEQEQPSAQSIDSDSMPSVSEDIAAQSENGGYSLREYLQTEYDPSPRSNAKEAAEAVQRLRLRYSKRCSARFFSHLELASIFFRSARRAGVPIVFSKGFNPKPKFAFGPPLQLGITSDTEYVDIFLSESFDPAEVQEAFNTSLPDGFGISDCMEVPLRAPSIQSTLVSHSYFTPIASAELEQLKTRMKQVGELEVSRVNKKGKQLSFPLSEYLSEFSIDEDGLKFTLGIDSVGRTIKPSEFTQTVLENSLYELEVHKFHTELKDELSS